MPKKRSNATPATTIVFHPKQKVSAPVIVGRRKKKERTTMHRIPQGQAAEDFLSDVFGTGKKKKKKKRKKLSKLRRIPQGKKAERYIKRFLKQK